MLGIILAAVGLLICAYIGIAVDGYYKARLNIVKHYLGFIRYSERETEFLKTDMPRLLAEYECDGEFKKMLAAANAEITAGREPHCETDKLKKGDLNEVNAFLKGLTECDYYSKNALFKYSLQVASEMENIAEKEKKQKGELIKKLMFLLGAGIVVLAL